MWCQCSTNWITSFDEFIDAVTVQFVYCLPVNVRMLRSFVDFEFTVNVKFCTLVMPAPVPLPLPIKSNKYVVINVDLPSGIGHKFDKRRAPQKNKRTGNSVSNQWFLLFNFFPNENDFHLRASRICAHSISNEFVTRFFHFSVQKEFAGNEQWITANSQLIHDNDAKSRENRNVKPMNELTLICWP